MNKKLTRELMDRAYRGIAIEKDEILKVAGSKISLARIGFCMMLYELNIYREQIKKNPLKVKVVESPESQIDIVINGNKLKLIGAGESAPISKSAKEFPLIYSQTGSAIVLKLGERLGTRIFIPNHLFDKFDFIWKTAMAYYKQEEPDADGYKEIENKLTETILPELEEEEKQTVIDGTVEEHNREELNKEETNGEEPDREETNGEEPNIEETNSEELSREDTEEDTTMGLREFEGKLYLPKRETSILLNTTISKVQGAINKGTLELVTYTLAKNSVDRTKHFIPLKSLMRFITSESFITDNAFPKTFPLEKVKEGLDIDDIPATILDSMDGDVLRLDDLVSLLGVLTAIPALNKINKERKKGEAKVPEEPIFAEGEFDASFMEVREIVIANLFDRVGITPENLIFSVSRTIFTTKEERAVLDYMRGNINDVVLFMAPELRDVLRSLVMQEPSGHLMPRAYAERIRREYPTRESIGDISVERVEEILMPGALSFNVFRGSLFLLVEKVYPGIDPFSLKNLPESEFAPEHVASAASKLIQLIHLATSAERAMVFRGIATVLTALLRRQSNQKAT